MLNYQICLSGDHSSSCKRNEAGEACWETIPVTQARNASCSCPFCLEYTPHFHSCPPIPSCLTPTHALKPTAFQDCSCCPTLQTLCLSLMHFSLYTVQYFLKSPRFPYRFVNSLEVGIHDGFSSFCTSRMRGLSLGKPELRTVRMSLELPLFCVSLLCRTLTGVGLTLFRGTHLILSVGGQSKSFESVCLRDKGLMSF